MPPDSEDNAANPSRDLEEPLLSQQTETQVATSAPNGENDDDKDVVVKLCGRRCLKLNHNVFLNLVLCVLYGMSDSLWSGTVFAAYLKRLGREENSIVGDIEAINGLAVLFSALPVGYIADRYGRDKMIRAGGILFMVTAVLHGWTMAWIGTDETKMSDKDRETSLIVLGVVMALWGIGGGIVSGPAQALYADSTPVGERSQYYHYLFVTYLVSSCLGPIVSIILFQKIGDEWNLFQLRTIVYVGLGMEVCNAIIMMFFDDKKALEEGGGAGEETEGEGGSSAADAATSSSTTLENTENGLTEPLLNSGDETPTTDANVQRRWMIPYILFVSSLVFSIGSGMTVKFFPLFFKEEVGMSPSQVQVIYVLVPVFMAILSGLGTRLSKSLGRVETTVLLQVLGVSCLYAMVFFKQFLDPHPFVLVPVYVLRTGLMNSPYPLLESILMDFVPKEQRARWKSLESIAQFGWCGSAAVGGYISDRWDYTHTFFITALVQTVGIILTACLFPLVPRSEVSLSRTASSPDLATSSNNNDTNETCACCNGNNENTDSGANNPAGEGTTANEESQ